MWDKIKQNLRGKNNPSNLKQKLRKKIWGKIKWISFS